MATSLRANLSFILVGNLIYAGAQWGMVVALARIGSPTMVGDLSLALAVTAPIIIFAMLNTRAAQATDQDNHFAFRDFAQLRIFCLACASTAIGLLLAASDYNNDTATVITLVAISKISDAAADTVHGELQKQERMARIAGSRATRGVLQFFALTGTVGATGNLVAGAAGMAAASLVTTAIYDYKSYRLLRDSASRPGTFRVLAPPDTAALRRLFLLAAPLGLASSIESLNANIPRYFLEAYAGREGLGYYSALAQLMMGQALVLGAAGAAAAPRLARRLSSDIADFIRTTNRLLALGFGVAAASVTVSFIAGERILSVLYAPSYAAHSDLLVWLMLVSVPANLCAVVSTALLAAHRFRILTISSATMAVTTTAAAMVLIPARGPVGAAWALGLGSTVRLILSTSCLLVVLRQRRQESSTKHYKKPDPCSSTSDTKPIAP